ncbi:MAG: FkbM family methyltransferase [Mediterranea sp.]|jgi:FkbM family methyltransferase|nr:FkbM family methyltransferase [Mediterranea sp.]
MQLFKNILIGICYKRWSLYVSLLYLIRKVLQVLHCRSNGFSTYYVKANNKNFVKNWLKKSNGTAYFDFVVAKMPNCSESKGMLTSLTYAFDDIYLIPVFFNENYDSRLFGRLDPALPEGPYCYTNKALDIDVTLHKGDVVIDAGAWIGDFSAYASAKGAICYAFEPVSSTQEWLKQTINLNKQAEGKIIPVQQALSNHTGEMEISITEHGGGVVNSITQTVGLKGEIIQLTTIDRFVEDKNINCVDFIKADIEGAERDMLRGATDTLRRFAPKLAICTYHLPDDPQVLTQIIMEANPKYRIAYTKHKLFAVAEREI